MSDEQRTSEGEGGRGTGEDGASASEEPENQQPVPGFVPASARAAWTAGTGFVRQAHDGTEVPQASAMRFLETVFFHVTVIDVPVEPDTVSIMGNGDIFLVNEFLRRSIVLYQPSGPPPASQEMVNAVTRKLYTKPLDGEAATCVICVESYNQGDELFELPCKHQYHQTCVTQWLLKHNTCPICRSPLPDVEERKEGGSKEEGARSTDAMQEPSSSQTVLGTADTAAAPSVFPAMPLNIISSGPHEPAAPAVPEERTPVSRLLSNFMRDRICRRRRRDSADTAGASLIGSGSGDSTSHTHQVVSNEDEGRRTRLRLMHFVGERNTPAEVSTDQRVAPVNTAVPAFAMSNSLHPSRRTRAFMLVRIRASRNDEHGGESSSRGADSES
eukprot:CAMPEP_0198724632 /NCGR_PEP_ID=MMETSP1475-20131203/2084_1 /TAXON_ID= ORGANISM="Unidentified sp., Strain CCMP1999" /NCGR_SAMPLE_ID=MMETSP1475 /ASSEMBLY_ACC=CAM_ASM_001111 /LENGTH=385 /DNA_ID=CAMNT_0044486215 /DNA_START=150 /DNA_END=1310 /DNA_ORIENTATION=-